MLSAIDFAHSIHRAAPRLARHFFTCQRQHAKQCSHIASAPTQLRRPCIAKCSQSIPPWSKGFLISQARHFRTLRPLRASLELPGSSAPRRPRFPETSSNAVAYWLLGSAASVFGIVIFGGLTRLTESGLSITEWKPVTGSLPPLSEADWASEFLKYQSSPEYRMLNPHMTLEEFKSIYWMEWIHRIWGRVIGLTFILPAAYFIARRRVSSRVAINILGIAGLIGFQGFIGWWMVKSGLKDDLFRPGSQPRVSQYRLASHLGTAFVVYLAMLWNGLSILRTNRILSLSPQEAQAYLSTLRHPALRTVKVSVALLTALVFTTAMSGALVAGLDAGLIYNEFPYMGLGLTPPKSELFDPFYSHVPDRSDLVWRNALENPSLVQLDHRILATTTFTAVMALFAYSRMSANMVKFLPKDVKRGVHGVVGFVWLQVILGISTLIYLVPLPLASAHQAGALALLSWTVVLGSRTWYPKLAGELVAKRMGDVVRGVVRVNGQSTNATQAAAGAGALMAGLSPLALAMGGSAALRTQKSKKTGREEVQDQERSALVRHEEAFLRKQQVFRVGR